jgi:ubiquinone/menaquinone biosynthesis C-methylase UbiE
MPEDRAIQQTIYRLDGPLRWAVGENYELVDKVAVRPGHQILDIGAGTGYLSIPLAAKVGRDGRVAALDLHKEMLSTLARKAEKRGLGQQIVCTTGHACDLPFTDETFDFVFCSYLLHELGDEAPEALREMYRVLKPLGQVVLADYRRIEDEEQRQAIESWYAVQADSAGPGEVHLRFGLGEMEQMLLQAGFRDVSLATWKGFHMHATARRLDEC